MGGVEVIGYARVGSGDEPPLPWFATFTGGERARHVDRHGGGRVPTTAVTVSTRGLRRRVLVCESRGLDADLAPVSEVPVVFGPGCPSGEFWRWARLNTDISFDVRHHTRFRFLRAMIWRSRFYDRLRARTDELHSAAQRTTLRLDGGDVPALTLAYRGRRLLWADCDGVEIRLSGPDARVARTGLVRRPVDDLPAS